MITHEIIGDDMQAVVISMAAGDEVRALGAGFFGGEGFIQSGSRRGEERLRRHIGSVGRFDRW